MSRPLPFWRYPKRLSVTDYSFVQRLLSKTVKKNGCWLFTGCRSNRGGYGELWYKGKLYYAHRLSYAFFVCDIPEGMTINHTCKNTNCVNPDHLRLATHEENSANIEAPF